MDEIQQNKRNNLRCLRRYLGYTQSEFIQRFLTEEDGKPTISVATLSNLESKGGVRLNEVILSVSESLGIDAMLFSMDPERFAENVEVILPKAGEPAAAIEGKSASASQLLNRLTMYFAEALFDKKLKMGDKIESDRVLAERFGVGRSAIREALKVLDILGMIDIRPGQGTFISSGEANFFIVPLSWSLFLNSGQIDSILEVRNILEIRATELAATCQQEDLMEKLHSVSTRTHDAYIQHNRKAFLDCDLEFHLYIAECSQNPVIYGMIQTISNLMRHISGTGMVNDEQIHAIYMEHQLIYGAILTHDSEAAGKFMKNHLTESMQRYNYR